MKIIKKGSRKLIREFDKNYIFTCKRCGCVYRANEREYWKYTSESSSGKENYAFSHCPYCGSVVDLTRVEQQEQDSND